MAKMKQIYMEILEKYGYDKEVTPELIREYLKDKEQEESK